MKKAKPGKRATAKKSRPGVKKTSASKRTAAKKSTAKKRVAPKTVADYLAGVPEPTRSAVNQIRVAIRSVVPEEATEVISYGIPAFRHKTVLVWYAAFANHCSLFPTAAIIEEFKDELKGFFVSKGTVHFPIDRPMPVELIKKMVKARVEQSGN